MINIQLKRNLLAVCAAVVAFGGFATSASAATIDSSSEIALFGAYTPDNTNLALATSVSFGGPGTPLIAGGANDFAFAVGGNAMFNGFSIDIGSPTSIFTFAGGGEFTATSSVIDFASPSALDITLFGFWSLDGFDDTNGQLILTFDSLGNEFTFSGSGIVTGGAPVPVPAAVWLLASALVGLGLNRRR